mgnify:CR=1 FL=1|tara:strand:- start:301 stop:930 length:630 start_codon:yes stop_codon:yes gene_type:complete
MDVIKSKNISLYKSLDDISIYRFDKALNGDLRYLSKKKDVEKIIIDVDFQNVWSDLINEYSIRTKNNTTIRIYLLIGEISYLESRNNVVPSLINNIIKSKDEEITKESIDHINRWGFPINSEKSINEELKKIMIAINNSHTKIKRKTAEYKDLTKDKGSQLTLIQQKLKLDRHLGVKIDLKKDTVSYWLACWDELELLTSEKRKSLSNG